MTTQALERAARAVCRSDYLLMPRYRKPGAEAALDAAVDDDWQAYVDHSRAVLVAVREPDKEMLIAGNDQDGYYNDGQAYNAECSTHWTAMIDAILGEGEGE